MQVSLDPEHGARLIDALQRTVDKMRAERGESIPGEPPRPSFAALRADALMRLVDGERAETELVVHASRARGLAIDDRTGVCKWDGVSMDASMAVEGVLQARGEFEF